MSKPSNYGPNFDIEDAFGGFLDAAAKLCFWAGMGAVVLSVGFLGFYFFHFLNGATGDEIAHASTFIPLMSKLLVAGSIAGAVGSTYLFWGEETLHAIQLIVAGALWFAPFLLPMMASGQNVTDTSGKALQAIQQGGTILGIISLGALVIELAIRMRARMIEGAKADSLKYGKGIKEEKNIQNRFMGKCWQLPYCRKFVRERCPIYHSRRTCWKERVGCMCEEEVIRNAMENRPIPKDAVAASRYIPVNNRITMGQKRERCRQCVIFNEHLKHKYKLFLPITISGFALLYVVARNPLLAWTGSLITQLDRLFGQVTLGAGSVKGQLGMLPFQELLLGCFMIVLLAYVLKVLEYVIFKLKV
jgi:hypothetical protein